MASGTYSGLLVDTGGKVKFRMTVNGKNCGHDSNWRTPLAIAQLRQ